jgi:hypothetical protein
MRSARCCPSVAIAAIGAFALGALACGSDSIVKKDSGVTSGAGGAAGATSTVGSDGSLGTDGAPAAGGAQGTGGFGGTGGSFGTGGATNTGGTKIDAADAFAALDVGVDASGVDASALDADADSGAQPCSDAACRSNQTCMLIGGGPQPPCDPPDDAGTCPDWLVLVGSCGGNGGPSYRTPGCTTPPDSPKCYEVPDGCADPCTCICGQPRNLGCNPGPGYLLCGRP